MGLARKKLGLGASKTHPYHGATAVAPWLPWSRSIKQSSNRLHGNSMLLKLENILVLTIQRHGEMTKMLQWPSETNSLMIGAGVVL